MSPTPSDPLFSLARRLAKVVLGLSLVGAVAVASSARAKDAGAPAGSVDGGTASAAKKARRVELSVTDKGFEPSPIKVKKGEPLELVITRKTDMTCATEIVLKEHDINTKLPLNEAVTVTFTPNKAGQLKYGCAMGQMIAGVLSVE